MKARVLIILAFSFLFSAVLFGFLFGLRPWGTDIAVVCLISSALAFVLGIAAYVRVAVLEDHFLTFFGIHPNVDGYILSRGDVGWRVMKRLQDMRQSENWKDSRRGLEVARFFGYNYKQAN